MIRLSQIRHMSAVVVLNSVELLVHLMRFPGQLIPQSTKAIFMAHISGAGESDSAKNDSCDSPLEPNSPLYGFSERIDNDSSEKDDNLHHQRRLESSLNVPGPSLRSKMMRFTSSIDGKWSLSHSEPDIAATFWRRSQRKVINEPRTASSRIVVFSYGLAVSGSMAYPDRPGQPVACAVMVIVLGLTIQPDLIRFQQCRNRAIRMIQLRMLFLGCLLTVLGYAFFLACYHPVHCHFGPINLV